MKHRIARLLLLAILPALIAGCAKPEAGLLAYLDTFYSGDIAGSYDYLCETDRAAVSREKYVENINRALPVFMTAYFDRYSYQILSIDGDRNQATAEVEIVYPHFKRILAELLTESQRQIYNDPKTAEKALAEIRKAYADKPLPMAKKKIPYRLVRENMRWKLSFGFAEQLDKM